MATFEQLVAEARDAPFGEYAGRLRELHETAGAWPATVRQRRFLVIAAKPTRRE